MYINLILILEYIILYFFLFRIYTIYSLQTNFRAAQCKYNYYILDVAPVTNEIRDDVLISVLTMSFPERRKIISMYHGGQFAQRVIHE